MKKTILAAFFTVFALNALPLSAKETTTAHDACNASKQLTKEEVKQLESRLYEIREMASEELNNEEKATLRKEVQDIRKQFSQPLGGGIYISAGALILIILLLIILL